MSDEDATTIQDAKDRARDICRDERETESWTTGDSATYRIFFSLGFEAAVGALVSDAATSPTARRGDLVATVKKRCPSAR